MSMTEKLAYIKKLRHLTTEEIARHSGVPVGTLNKIFSGQTRHPAAEPMARLAQSLRVPIRYLLDDALPLECYISLNGSDGPILLSDEEIRLLMRLRELEPRSRRAMGIMAELLGAPAPCLAGGIATRHLFCFLAAGSEAENPAWGVLRPRPVLIPEPDAAAREADFAVLLPDGSLEPLYSAGAVLLCRRERTLPPPGICPLSSQRRASSPPPLPAQRRLQAGCPQCGLQGHPRRGRGLPGVYRHDYRPGQALPVGVAAAPSPLPRRPHSLFIKF